MIKLKRIAAKSWVTYPEFELKLDQPCIVIRGVNKDSKNKEGLNRVGKSLVPAVIPRILFGSAPQPMKSTKRGNHAFRTGTQLELDCEVRNNSYRVQSYYDRTSRLRIIEAKGNRGIRLKAVAEEALEEIFPHNEEQFYSTVYIDGRRPSLFQYGSDAQRFEFFEKVFDLGIYRRLGEELKPFLQDTAKAASERTIYEEQLTGLGEKPNVLRLKTVLNKAIRQRDEQKKFVDRAQRRQSRLELYWTALNSIPEGNTDDPAALQKEIDGLSRHIETTVKRLEQKRLYAKTEEARVALNAEFSKLKDVVVDPRIKEDLADAQANCLKAESEWAAFEEVRIALQAAEKDLAAISVSEKAKKATLSDLQRALQNSESRLAFTTKLASLLKADIDHHTTCPVCAGKFEAAQHEEFKERMQTAHAQAKTRRELILRGISWHEQNKIVSALREKCVEPASAQENWQHTLTEIEFRYQQMRRKVLIKNRIEALPVIEMPGITLDLNTLRKHRHTLNDRLQTARRIAQARDLLKSLKITLSKAEAKRHLDNLQTILPGHEEKLARLETQISDLRTRLNEAQSVSQRMEDLAKKIADLDKALADQPMLAALKSAFGPRGLVKHRTQMLSKAFESALNEYAPFVFDEPISFRLDVTETKFPILATRNKIEDEVRSLSGQESRAFSLITLLSLLRFLPPHLRCNTIVLDEVEANMDAPSRRLLVEKLVPELQRFVDHIIIVTPLSRSELFIPDAKEYYAVKNNGISTLVPFETMRAA